MRLVPMSRAEVFSGLFGRSRPDSLVAFGSIRPDRGGEQGLRPLALSRPINAADSADGLETHGINPTHIRWNLYGVGVLPKEEHVDVDGAVQDRLEAVYRGQDPRHFLAHAYRLAELVALNVDLDVGIRKDGTRYIDADTALNVVNRLVQYGKLPAPSMVGFSGQGLYIMYALAGKPGKGQGERLTPATPKNRSKFKEAAQAIIDRCIRISRRFIPDGYPTTLNPDPSSKSPVQMFKTPDSRHPKTGEPIRYYRYMVDDNDTVLRRFSLEELIRWRVVKREDARTKPVSYKDRYLSAMFDDATQDKRRYTARAGQAVQPFIRRLEDLKKLAVHRGAIPEGKRSLWSLILYNTYRDLYIRHEHQGDNDTASMRAVADTMRFNVDSFDPPLELQDIRHIAAKPRRDFRNSTLVTLLGVDYREAVEAGLGFIVPERRRLEIEEEKRVAKRAASATAMKAIRNGNIIADFRAGMTALAIADKYGLSEPRVWQLKRQFRAEGCLE